jgi:hypothetical protein
MTATTATGARDAAHHQGSDPISRLADVAGGRGLAVVANLALRFCVELSVCGALGYVGASVHGPVMERATLAVAAPLVAMLLWSRFLSPRAPRALHGMSALVAESAVFVAAASALAVSGLPTLAWLFATVAVANALLVRVLGPRPPVADASTGRRPTS